MLTFPPNSSNFIGRLFFLILTFFLGYLFINFGLKEPNMEKTIFRIKEINFEFKAAYLMYLLIGTVGFLALTIIVSLLGINKIQVDTFLNTVTFISLFSKTTININEIDEYFNTIKKNPYKVFYGLLLKLKDKRPIQLAGQNIKSLSDFRNYLTDRKINYAGQRKMKFPFN
jgi:hypothetical protein